MTQEPSVSMMRAGKGLTAEEWRIVRVAPVNMLLVDPDGLAAMVVDAIWPDLCQPIEVWHPASGQALPRAGCAGTLIVQDVDTLPRDDQRAMCDWLEMAAGRTRVVSTTRQPLFPLVAAGTFEESLYYRLNILCFEVTAWGS